jgi:hypothetical protein
VPDPFKHWTGQWLLCMSGDTPGVILSLDARLQSQAAALSFVEGLQRLLGGRLVNLFPCFYDPPGVSALAWRHQMNERLRKPLAWLDDSADWRRDIRHWGINE